MDTFCTLPQNHCHHHHHHIEPLSIHLLDEDLSIAFPWQSVLGILLPCTRSPDVIDVIPLSPWGSTSWSTTIHLSLVCYLKCPSTVLNASYMTCQSLFSDFDDMHDVTNFCFVPYPLSHPMILPRHTNHCLSIFLWAAARCFFKALINVKVSDA